MPGGFLRRLYHDTKFLMRADEPQSGSGPRRVLRTVRKRFKRRLNGKAAEKPRYFCLNSGGCGSKYLVRLLADNGWPSVWHEKQPDFNRLGIEHYESELNESRLARLLRYTRWDVFLEANNRLFSLSQPLAQAFPGCRFIHLHRDGRQAVSSAMSRPNVERYLATSVRFRGSLAGFREMRPLERMCHYWNNMNRRILDDLERTAAETRPALSLSFESLVEGRLDALEQFAGRPIAIRRREAVNRGPTKVSARFPEFADWRTADQRLFLEICGETMNRLGRSL